MAKQNPDQVLQRKYENLKSLSKKWATIDPSNTKELRSYYTKLRTLLNSIARYVVMKADPQGKFESNYNELVKKYQKLVDFELKPYSGNHKDTAKLIKQIENDLFAAADRALEMTKLKIEFLDQASMAFSQNEVDIIKPRVTLLDIGSARAKEIQQYIIKRVQRGLDNQQSFDDVQVDVIKELETEYPDGYIEIPLDDKGKKVRKLSLISYSEGWIQDMQSKATTQSTLSWMSAAKLNVVQVVGGVTNNKICDPYSTPGSNIFYVFQSVPGLRKLTAAPPYHVRCSKRLVPYFGDYSNVTYDDKPPKTEFQKETTKEIS